MLAPGAASAATSAIRRPVPASIPLALSVGRQRGQIKQGDLIVTEAIGGGLAWGSVLLRY